VLWNRIRFRPKGVRLDRGGRGGGVGREHQYGTVAGRFATLDGVQADEIDLTLANGHSSASSPTES
jgi:hypothetical protein